MYEAHFGLDERPFGETVSPSAYVPCRAATPCCAGCATHSSTARDRRCSSVRQARARPCWHADWRASCGGPAVHVTFPALSAAELVAHLAEEFGGSTVPPASLHAALRQVRDQLAALAARRPAPAARRRRCPLDRGGLDLRSPAALAQLRNQRTSRSLAPLRRRRRGLARASRRPGRSARGPLPARPPHRSRVVDLRPRPARRRRRHGRRCSLRMP